MAHYWEPQSSLDTDMPVPPESVRNNARRGLEMRREHGRGGTEVGVARARDLARGADSGKSWANAESKKAERVNKYFGR